MINAAQYLPGQTQDLAKIRILNASPDTPAVDLLVNNELVSKNHKYKVFSEYAEAKPGIYNIKVTPVGLNTVIAIEEDVELLPGMIYTLAIVGVTRDLGMVLVSDRPRKIDQSKAYMRFINLSPYTTEYDIALNKKATVDGLYYLDISDYYTLDPKKYVMDISDTDTEKLVMTNPNMTLSAGKMYACYIVGFENAKPSLEVLLPLEGATYLKM